MGDLPWVLSFFFFFFLRAYFFPSLPSCLLASFPSLEKHYPPKILL